MRTANNFGHFKLLFSGIFLFTETLEYSTEADKDHKLSLPLCRFHFVASKLSLPCCRVKNKGGGLCCENSLRGLLGFGGVLSQFCIFIFVSSPPPPPLSKLSLPSCRFHVVASTLSLPRCRFHVVASTLSLPRCCLWLES